MLRVDTSAWGYRLRAHSFERSIGSVLAMFSLLDSWKPCPGSRYSGGMEDSSPRALNEKTPLGCGAFSERRLPESNRRKRLCRPLRSHSAKAPSGKQA
jgi:hypothetical protein